MSDYTKLPADLPEDWAPSQVVTPQGVEAGLPERYGYNYLMKQVNEAQRMCNALRDELDHKTGAQMKWFDLPLRTGYLESSPPQYAKDALGFVHLRGYLSKNGGAVPFYDIFADLPEGYYVNSGVIVVGLVRSIGNSYYGEAGAMRISSGEMQLCSAYNAGDNVYAISFHGVRFHVGL